MVGGLESAAQVGPGAHIGGVSMAAVRSVGAQAADAQAGTIGGPQMQEQGGTLRLVGVDGCRAGWVVASSDLALATVSFTIVPSFAALLAGVAAADGGRAVVAVDIPIGLPPGVSADAGPLRPEAARILSRRRADDAARAFLGPRRAASVFSAPCRPTLAAATYREACRLEATARGAGLGLSQQAYHIIPKIREVDDALLPAHQSPVARGPGIRVREVHPEVTFALLAGLATGDDDAAGHGLAHSKRRCSSCPAGACPGEAVRLGLLQGRVPPFDPSSVQRDLTARHRAICGAGGRVVGRDDIVDAVACLVTAQRIATGTARTFPADGPQVDGRGLRMEIVA